MKNRTWIYPYAGGERGEIFTVRKITDKEILEEYWDFWSEECEKTLENQEKCIQEWVDDNEATEWTDEESD